MAASPLNNVKLELGIILALAVMMLLLVPSLSSSLMVQVVLLLGYGVAAMGWIIYRVRKTVTQLQQSQEVSDGENR